VQNPLKLLETDSLSPIEKGEDKIPQAKVCEYANGAKTIGEGVTKYRFPPFREKRFCIAKKARTGNVFFHMISKNLGLQRGVWSLRKLNRF